MKALEYNGMKIEIGIMQVKEATGDAVRNPAEVAALFADLQNASQEVFCIITMNAKAKIIDRHLITLGVVDAAMVHPREIFRRAIADGACSLIAVHNHPSGDPQPSVEDMRITRQLVEAGKILDIRVTDHVIIGRPSDSKPGWVSLRESGQVEF